MAGTITDQSVRDYITKAMGKTDVEMDTVKENPVLEPEPVKWVRMTRVLVYEGPEELIRREKNNRALKESKYGGGIRILEESLNLEDMTEPDRKVAEVDINLTNRDSGYGLNNALPAIGGAYGSSFSFGSGQPYGQVGVGKL